MASSPSNDRLFWDAIASGDVQLVRQEVSNRRNVVDATLPLTDQAYGWTAVHFAAQNGFLEIIEELVKAGSCAVDQFTATPEWMRSTKHTPLMLAAMHGHANVIEMLVEVLGSTAIDSPDPDTGTTAMHLAAFYGHVGVIETLLRLGSQALDARDRMGTRPLGRAAQNGQLEVIEALVRLGSGALDAPDLQGFTPMHEAASNGHVGVIEMLLRLGSQALDLVAEPQLPTDPAPVTNLHEHEAGANDGDGDDNGDDDDAYDDGDDDDDEDDYDDYVRSQQWTPLCCAASSGHAHVIEALVQLGSKAIDTPDEHGRTPMHAAARNLELSVIELLVRLNSRAIDAVDKNGETPLHCACQSAYDTEAIKTLVRLGSQAIGMKNKRGLTPAQATLARLDEDPDDEEERVKARLLLALGDDAISFDATQVVVGQQPQQQRDSDEAVVQELRFEVYFANWSLLDRLLFYLVPVEPLRSLECSQVAPVTNLMECLRRAFPIVDTTMVGLVMEQVACTQEQAEAALRQHQGDVVCAILELTSI